MTLGLFLNIFIVLLTKTVATHHVKAVTLPIEDRINLLKYQNVKHVVNEEVTTLVNENIDYVDLGSAPISPIHESDEKLENGQSNLRQLKTTTTTVQPWDTSNKFSIGREGNAYGKVKHRPKKKFRVQKPVDVFYRRLLTKELMNKPVQWIHCQDVITPYFNGLKKALGPPKRLSHNATEVTRLTELLSKNITGFSQQDVRALMYHINEMKIRLFQWDVSAIRVLLNTINPNKKHTFKILKRSIQALLKSWHLDFHDTKKLLQQTRLFRPPCVDNNSEGSTLSSKVSRFIKSTTPTTTDDCDDDD